MMTGVPLVLVKGLYQQLEHRYYECFPEQKQSNMNTSSISHQPQLLQSLPTSEQSLGDRKQSATSKTSLQLYNSGSSNKKT